MQTCVIFNPSARGEKAQAFCTGRENLFPNCQWRRTTRAGQARDIAAQAVREKFQKIVAVGGDGTVNEVINGIADVPGGLESTDFGVLPLGTVNVFAREIGMPLRLDNAVPVLVAGRTKSIDLGCAEYTEGGQTRQRYFIQLAGAGLDSRAIELVDWQLKKKLGALAYVVAGCKALAEKQPTITVHGQKEISGELILIGNGRYYGGTFAFFPEANLQDGLLHFCVFPKATVPRALSGFAALITGTFAQWPSVKHHSTDTATLTSPSRVILQLDGENVCELPVKLTVRPKALRVIVP